MNRFLRSLLGDMDDLKLIAQAPVVIAQKATHTQPLTRRKLIEMESAVGGRLFGSVQSGGRREFFCLDDVTWIWYEQWRDSNNRLQQTTVRYEIQPQGIMKVQEGARYSYLQGTELDNFMGAIRAYGVEVQSKIYAPLLSAA